LIINTTTKKGNQEKFFFKELTLQSSY